MRKKLLTSAIFCKLVLAGLNSNAQAAHKSPGAPPHLFPELEFTNIAGAPKLSTPMLLTGITGPLKTTGMGWAAPLVYDYDGDGLDDIIAGEFGTGMETGSYVGHMLRVWRNIGTAAQPAYHGSSNFVRTVRGSGNGTAMSIHQFCCMAFTPMLVDMDGDGRKDIVTGQYEPGHIIWFKNTKAGFEPGRTVPQAGMDSKKNNSKMGASRSKLDTSDAGYWLFSSAAFGDFYGNGLPDLIVGGAVLRIAKNTGNKTDPAYGVRRMLKDTKGNYLSVWDRTEMSAAQIQSWGEAEVMGNSMMPYAFDWDNDGIIDLLVADGYDRSGMFAITFFKGIKRKAGEDPVFEPGIPLFRNKQGGKSFPGSALNICVADWNNDGVNDLIIGTNMVTQDGFYSPKYSWGWEIEEDTYKKNPVVRNYEAEQRLYRNMKGVDSLLRVKGYQGMSDEEVKAKGYVTPNMLYKNHFIDYGMETIGHEGYLYVLIGRK